MAHTVGNTSMFGPEQHLTGAYLVVALLALFVGVVTGLFQALSHAGLNLYPQLTPVVASYYQGLTLHGVMNALVWTTFFICGFLQFIATRALGRPLARHGLAWATYGMMTGGLVLAAIPLLGNAATVMFTFYPPLRAHWAFYVGLTLVVVGTWLVTLNLVLTSRAWRVQHPGERTPLAAFMALVTFAMWSIASLGLAVEMLGMLIPWSLGWQHGTDPLGSLCHSGRPKTSVAVMWGKSRNSPTQPTLPKTPVEGVEAATTRHVAERAQTSVIEHDNWDRRGP
jgi:cytochrome c oxidase subunit 1